MLNNILIVYKWIKSMVYHQFKATSLLDTSKKDSNFNRIIMNTLALIILSLTAIATAAPGGWRCGRSPGWCRNKG